MNGVLPTLRKAVVVLCVPLLLAPAHAASLADAIDAIVRSKPAARARIGVCVAELGSGRERYAHDADRPLRLASNTKLLTVWAALELLGAEHPLRTTLYRRGTLAGQVLLGDLVLEGRGDPTLGQRFDGAPEVAFRRMARAVRQAGIVEVRGDLVLDARYFAPPLQHPGWPRDQLDRWYEAPVSALTLQDGCVDVTVGPGAAAGVPAVVRLVPAGAPLRVENRCTTVGKDARHVIAVGRKPATDVIVVRGSVRLGSRPRTVSIALRDPAIVVGHVLRRALEAEGVSVGGQVRLATADDPPASRGSVPIAGCATPLAQTVPVILKRSQNLWAESLCKVLGAERGGEGSFRAGSGVVRKRVLALGVAPEQIALVDGSGLARDNRASARALVTVLRAAARGPNAALFVGALPIGGLDGTLRKRLRDRPDAARVRAKTGTIRGVSTLSGYVLAARPGEATLVFSILTNGVRGGAGAARRLQDRIVEVLLDTHLPAQPAATPAGAEAGR